MVFPIPYYIYEPWSCSFVIPLPYYIWEPYGFVYYEEAVPSQYANVVMLETDSAGSRFGGQAMHDDNRASRVWH